MKTMNSIVLGLMVCAMASVAACGDPAAPAPAAPAPAQPAAPAPTAQPVPAPEVKPAEEATCLGPDGKQHKFPLDVYDSNADGYKTIQDAIVKAKAENKRVLAMWVRTGASSASS